MWQHGRLRRSGRLIQVVVSAGFTVYSLYVRRYECGISKPTGCIQNADREDIISSLWLHFVVLTAKAELDDLVAGLKSLDILSPVRENPVLSCQLFIKGTPKCLSADTLYDMFTADLSPSMSNWRDKEEAQLVNLANFLQFIESKFYTFFYANTHKVY